MAELALRMVVSLAVVVGLLLLIARLGARRFSGRAGAAVQVLHRQQLGRGSALTVVTVGGRTLVLGTTEQQVRVLAELDADEAATVAGQDGAPLDPGTGTTDGDREDVTTRSPRLATVTALPSLSVVPAPADESEPATEQPEQTSRTDLGDPVDHRSE
ncbi:MAG: flagellar biosynthetic protein FliO, partial [Nocardioides sp.]|nr:flagellar biosynthetic protein FliO [Nocardioides sp.]